MIWVFLWLAGTVAAGIIARRRGRSAILWATLSLLLTPLVIPVLFILPPLRECPRCRGAVREDAEVCRHCSYEFP
jgi:hypothetical protein